jgi:hypothetical protein
MMVRIAIGSAPVVHSRLIWPFGTERIGSCFRARGLKDECGRLDAAAAMKANLRFRISAHIRGPDDAQMPDRCEERARRKLGDRKQLSRLALGLLLSKQ